jgi:hypothetical protein
MSPIDLIREGLHYARHSDFCGAPRMSVDPAVCVCGYAGFVIRARHAIAEMQRDVLVDALTREADAGRSH